MSKPKYRWWAFVRKMIRDYPSLKQDWRDIHEQSVTANYSGSPRGGGNGRSLESIALRQLPPDDQKVYDAVTRTVELVNLRPDGAARLDLIRLMYWQPKTLPLKSAALVLFISERTAKRWHGDFVRLVGKCYGFNVGTPEPK